MAQPYPVVGVPGTGVQARLELRDLQKNPIKFSLFIQAMNKLVNMNNVQDPNSKDYYNKPNSWWQMGSIHGLPYIPWSGDPKGPQVPDEDSQWGGYCYHASALFPPWHRVLLLLVEQAMVTEAVTIASGLKDEKWIQAAKELRFPYWDWTRVETAQEGIPKVCQEITVGIMKVDGTSVVVDNPLNHYKFAKSPGETQSAPYMDQWTRTYRWGSPKEQPTTEMYDQSLKAFAEGMNLVLGNNAQPSQLQPVHWLRAKIAALFTYDLAVKDSAYGGNMWGYFSNTGAQDDKVDPVMDVMPPSIEEPHNKVHLDIGGNGSMSFNDYAGFDPIFFLHHCNVDRLYAFWEYVYPEYWIGNGWKSTKTGKVTPFLTDSGTFVQDSGAVVNQVTQLEPFRSKSLEYWTSDDARGLLSTSPVDKYYTYPPITDPKTGMEVKVDVPYDVNDRDLRERYRKILYNEFSPDVDDIVRHHQDHSHLSPDHSRLSDLLLNEADGVVNLRRFFLVGEIPEFAFPGSYRLELYLLNHPQIHVINSVSVLGRVDPKRCAACRDRRVAGNHVRGHMPLDPRLVLYLIRRVEPDRLILMTELDHIVALIHESFGVRLVAPDGTRLATTDPGLSSNFQTLDPSKKPKLSLHSHIVGRNREDLTAPVSFSDHSHHGEYGVDMEWKAF